MERNKVKYIYYLNKNNLIINKQIEACKIINKNHLNANVIFYLISFLFPLFNFDLIIILKTK